MPRAAVICEFNPFHNGHKFLLQKIKEVYAEEVVCVMSGSFVQRGDIAVTDKYARTTAALQNGADMVAELPTVYAVASAQVFAKSGVQLAYELGCDTLCFGAEDRLDMLYEALDAIDKPKTQSRIAALMKDGMYYPRAFSEAVGGAYAEVISRPNNILAIEYIRACKTYGITPVAIERRGVDHDSDTVSDGIASATHIRDLIARGGDYLPYTPMRIDDPCMMAAIEPALLYRLKTMRAEDIARLPDVSEGLENRIAACAASYNSVEEILDNLKTKRYTMARLRRILLYALLGITAEMQRTPVPYARILGVRADRKNLITARSLPLIVDVRRGYNALDNSAREIFDVDIRAGEAMNIARRTGPLNEFTQGLITL